MEKLVKSWLLVFVFTVVFASLALAKDDMPSTKDVQAELGFPKVGTVFTYKIKRGSYDDHIIKCKVIEEGEIKGKPVHRVAILKEEGKINSKSDQQLIYKVGDNLKLYDAETRNFMSHEQKGQPTKFNKPHDGRLNFPLFVGKTYKSSFISGTSGKAAKKLYSSVRVESLQTVTVPAGSFDAFKIVQTLTLEQKGKSKYVRRVVNTFWYCPELKINVKKVKDHWKHPKLTQELVEYNSPT